MADEWDGYGDVATSDIETAQQQIRHDWRVMVGAEERFALRLQAHLAVPGITLQTFVDSLSAGAEAALRARWPALIVIGAEMDPAINVPANLPAKT